ncbi:MAG: hypothetical protein V4719_16715 [Planctomycetota bacterium]
MAIAQRCLLLAVLFGTCYAGHGWAQDCGPDCHTRIRTRVKIINRCHRCQRQTPNCGCAAPMMVQPIIPAAPIMVPQTTMQPVYETKYCPQRVVTNRTVTETQYRAEAYTETVPVQTTENITVDEGHWQQVWVAKPVTKQICKTAYTQRTACRTVPYQVNKVIPEVSTTMVPVQTVRYVARQTCVPACTPGVTTTMGAYPALSSYPMPTSGISTAYAPTPAYDSAPIHNPVPEARYLDTPSAAPFNSTQVDHSYSPPQAVPRRAVQPTSYADNVAPRVSAAGKFSAAPSAAAVWRANGAVTR